MSDAPAEVDYVLRCPHLHSESPAVIWSFALLRGQLALVCSLCLDDMFKNVLAVRQEDAYQQRTHPVKL